MNITLRISLDIVKQSVRRLFLQQVNLRIDDKGGTQLKLLTATESCPIVENYVKKHRLSA